MQKINLPLGIVLSMDDALIHAEMLADNHFYEHHMLDYIRSKFHGGTFIDCGANFGNHAVYFSKYCADHVFAIEPVRHNYELLVKNIDTNKCHNVAALQSGAGQFKGRATFVKAEGQRWSQCQLKDGDEINVITIDSLELRECKLIKIDCEGMEVAVISGAITTIANHKPEIFVEIWSDEELNIISEILSPFGYEMKERYNHAPTYHFSADKTIPVTYKKP